MKHNPNNDEIPGNERNKIAAKREKKEKKKMMIKKKNNIGMMKERR